MLCRLIFITRFDQSRLKKELHIMNIIMVLILFYGNVECIPLLYYGYSYKPKTHLTFPSGWHVITRKA